MKTSLRLFAFALLLLSSHAAFARAIYAISNNNRLLIMDADVPQEILADHTVTGLDVGDTLVGIDVRPATGQLYALSDGAGLYTINPATGAATKVGELAADPTDATNPFTALSGTNFGIDFNPVVDRLRVVSNTQQNLRIHPDTALVTTDTPLAFAVGDANAAATPNVSDVAYSNNVAGAASTSLFGIDDTTFVIVQQNPPNNGTLNTVAPFGVTNASHVGFDIAPDGVGFVGGKHTVPGTPVEYILATLDPITGNGESHGPIGDGTIPIVDIAVAPTVAFSASQYAIAEDGGSATITVKREGFLNTVVSVHYTTFTDSASAGTDYTTASGTLTFNATESTKTFQVPIIPDAFPEDDEFVGLFLTSLTGNAVLGSPGVASLRINANDRYDIVPPHVTFIGLTGPSRGINGAVVHFDEDLNPANATDLANYRLTVFPVNGAAQVKFFTAAVYDPVGRKVTLTLAPFIQTTFTRMALRVRSGATGIKDLAGRQLDGDRNGIRGGDAVQIFKVFSGTSLAFIEPDGDRVRLTLTGGGHLDGVLPIGGPATQTTQFWILDPIALQTTLRGVVAPSFRGDGIVVIAEIIGLDKKEFAPISTNPAFRINRLTFSSNATGLR